MIKHCNYTTCKHDDCPHHIANAGEEALKDYINGNRENFVHLEGNPMYCKKNDWNGYQVKQEKK